MMVVVVVGWSDQWQAWHSGYPAGIQLCVIKLGERVANCESITNTNAKLHECGCVCMCNSKLH